MECWSDCSLCDLHKLVNVTPHRCRISRYYAVGGNVFGHYASGTHNGVFANCCIRKNGCSGTDRSALLDYRPLHFPVRLGLQTTVGSCGPGIAIVDKRNSVADEDVVLDHDAFTNEGVARDFAMFADDRILLDFDESTYLRLITDLAPVEIYKLGELHTLTKLYVGSNAHERIRCMFSFFHIFHRAQQDNAVGPLNRRPRGGAAIRSTTMQGYLKWLMQQAAGALLQRATHYA